ncbi:hypothetical protein [Mesobacillus subterraneus]|uniref:Uncharacterized protein n=1 Tax=Mesobacillus subterraneus TaxID=285983 RepID=A0A427TJV0_9BACI|nr:hypothetical protein [Mesobacillus subterraneus]RSD24433.1 hypothetical protein EJA10_19315 [Mesobacillus subterraneus]
MADFMWLMYLGFMGTTAIWFLIKGKYKNKITKLDFIISIITWLGLFGYVTDTEMLTPLVWKIVFFGGLLWDVVFTIFFAERFADDFGFEDEGYEPMPLAAKLSGLIFIAPLYYGIFRYAF